MALSSLCPAGRYVRGLLGWAAPARWKPAAAQAVAPGPGLARRRRARSAV